MHTMRYVGTVGENGILTLKVEKPEGTLLEIIISDLDGPHSDETFELARHQEMTGFVKNILGKPEEDVWNDL